MKQKKSIRVPSILLIAALLLPLAGCAGSGPDPNPIDRADLIRTEMSDPPAEAAETPAPTLSADEAFAAIDEDFFRYYLSGDAVLLHRLVKDPKAMGFDAKDMPDTLGDFSPEANKSWIVKCKQTKAELEKLDYSALSPANQFAYDTFVQYLGQEIAYEDYYVYYEPLGMRSGVHTDLPFSFMSFDIKTETDAELYLTLLADVPRYFGQVLEHQKARAEKDIYMTFPARDSVQAYTGAMTSIRVSENPMLLAFDRKVNDLPGLSDETKADLIERNRALVQGEWTSAFRSLRNDMWALPCRKVSPLCQRLDPMDEDEYFAPDPYVEYYELRLRELSGMDGSVAEIRGQLQDALDILLKELEDALYSGPVRKRRDTFAAGTPDETLGYLKELSQGFLPTLQAHTVELETEPLSRVTRRRFLLAACIVPGIDDWTDNVVIFRNQHDNKYPLLTMARESYPGRLYQLNYQRSLPHLSLMQKTLPLTSYYEAWARFAEYLTAKHTALYPQNQLLKDTLLGSISAIQLALESIDVNYMGREGRHSYANWRFINDPFRYMEEAFGIANMFVLYDRVRQTRGDDFDEAVFLKEFLDLGPSYFNLIEEQF